MREIQALDDRMVIARAETALALKLFMDPTMKGSAAFAGIRYRTKPRLSDFFDMDLGRSRPESRHTALPPRRKDPNDE